MSLTHADLAADLAAVFFSPGGDFTVPVRRERPGVDDAVFAAIPSEVTVEGLDGQGLQRLRRLRLAASADVLRGDLLHFEPAAGQPLPFGGWASAVALAPLQRTVDGLEADLDVGPAHVTA